MTIETYEVLQDSQVSLICAKYGKPNYSNSLFSNITLELSNSFSKLPVCSDDPFGPGFGPPLAASSSQSTND